MQNFIEKFKENAKSNIIISSISVGLLFSGGFYYQANAMTLYDVYVDGQQIGTVSEEKIVTDWEKTKVEAIKKENGLEDAYVKNSITYQKKREFHGDFDNRKALNSLNEMIDFQTSGVEVKISGKVVGVVQNHEIAEKVMNDLKSQYQPKTKEKVSTSSVATEANKTVVQELKVKETFEESQVKVAPEKIMSEQELLKRLIDGTVQDGEYTVKQGDTISTIANQHGLTTKELYELNPNLQGEFINLGDILKVKMNKPLVTILTNEILTVTEAIPYQTVYENDRTMYKGNTKTVQAGQNGEKQLKYEVEKENGRIVKKNLIEEKSLKNPMNKIVKKGTKAKATVSRGAGSYSWPAVGGFVTSQYGQRWGKAHKGIDISGVSNKSIKAAASGRVTSVGWINGYGKSIIVDHGNGVTTWYTHLSQYNTSVGSSVSRGQKIGVMGDSGHTTGTNLHFEIRLKGVPQNPISYLSR